MMRNLLTASCLSVLAMGCNSQPSLSGFWKTADSKHETDCLVHIEGGKFDLVADEFASAGSVTIEGDRVVFHPKTGLGHSQDELLEAAKLSDGDPSPDDIRRLFLDFGGEFDKTRESLKLYGPKPAAPSGKPTTGNPIVNLRRFQPQSSDSRRTVSAPEAPLVGLWRSYNPLPHNPHPTPRELIVDGYSIAQDGRSILCLNADNTFVLEQNGEVKGNWAAADGFLALFLNENGGWSTGAPQALIQEQGQRLCIPFQKDQPTYFTRRLTLQDLSASVKSNTYETKSP